MTAMKRILHSMKILVKLTSIIMVMTMELIDLSDDYIHNGNNHSGEYDNAYDDTLYR